MASSLLGCAHVSLLAEHRHQDFSFPPAQHKRHDRASQKTFRPFTLAEFGESWQEAISDIWRENGQQFFIVVSVFLFEITETL